MSFNNWEYSIQKYIILFRATGQIEFRRGNETETKFKTFELKDDRIAMFEYKNYLKQFVVIWNNKL